MTPSKEGLYLPDKKKPLLVSHTSINLINIDDVIIVKHAILSQPRLYSPHLDNRIDSP